MPPIVILIDAENGPASKASLVRVEAQKRGEIVLQRVYANTQALRGWQKAIERYGMQHIGHKRGKNAADRRLIADMHRLFREEKIRLFCLMTDDADFVQAIRTIQKSGGHVFGIGSTHAARKLIHVCDSFTFYG